MASSSTRHHQASLLDEMMLGQQILASASAAAAAFDAQLLSAVGSTLLSASGPAVSAITFDQHCNMVRYPNSMSNLRRLRCYLLACQV